MQPVGGWRRSFSWGLMGTCTGQLPALARREPGLAKPLAALAHPYLPCCIMQSLALRRRYTDASKERFKSSTRLECMMQVGARRSLLVVVPCCAWCVAALAAALASPAACPCIRCALSLPPAGLS